MTNLFLLHDALHKSGIDVPPLSFRYLNLLCMDKGNSSSGEEEGRQQLRSLASIFTRFREILTEIDWELDSVWDVCDEEGSFQQRLHQIRQKILEMQSAGASGLENKNGKWILEAIERTREDWSLVLTVVPLRNARLLRGKIAELFLQKEEAVLKWKQLAQVPSFKKEGGMLSQLLDLYSNLLIDRGENPENDLIYSYFTNEYLNLANEKTSASISMMVSNALMPFVTAPFDRLFSSEATFDFSRVIDEGLLVVLDMPSSQYGVAQLLVSLMMKIDFFRMTLNRSRLKKRGEDRLVDQERHLIYLCDEFGSVATTGDQTGEAAFLDKVRECRCSCLLSMQGLPSLLRKFSEKEVDALLQNCGIKIFLRNDDPATNDYASRSLGSEIKVRLNQNAGAMEHYMDQQKKWGARAYTTSYDRAAKFSSDQFVTFRIGEGVLRLPARFGESMVRKVHFAFNPIPL
ncbi:MAG: TraM recognition domain-containing protein [Verrucomicrobiota bacterium]